MSKKTDSGYPARHGKHWTLDEMWKLCEWYVQPVAWFYISQKMDRTISACQARMRLIHVACSLAADKSATKILNRMAKQEKIRHSKV